MFVRGKKGTKNAVSLHKISYPNNYTSKRIRIKPFRRMGTS